MGKKNKSGIHMDTVLGTAQTGFKTFEEWKEFLDISAVSLYRRVNKYGPNDPRTVAPKKVSRRLEHVRDPFTGIETTIAAHSRRLKVSPSCLQDRLKNRGPNDPLTWHVGQIHSGQPSISTPIWEREYLMQLRKNPFTGQLAYDYEWAELYNMTTGSFCDRLNRVGERSRAAWSPNVNPIVCRRLENCDGINV